MKKYLYKGQIVTANSKEEAKKVVAKKDAHFMHIMDKVELIHNRLNNLDYTNSEKEVKIYNQMMPLLDKLEKISEKLYK